MHPRPGDMRILNNHVTLHARTEFGDPVLKPCLFRLWLASPDGGALPESRRPAYRPVAVGRYSVGAIRSTGA